MDSVLVGAQNRSTESANNGSPGFPIEGNTAEPGGRLHLGNTGSASAPGADPGGRLAPLHLPLLVHQKAEAHHLLLVNEKFMRQY